MIVNCTGRAVALIGPGGHLLTIGPSNFDARLVPKRIHGMEKNADGCRLCLAGAASVESLPPPREGVLYLVPVEVALLLAAERWDVCSVDPSSLVAHGTGPLAAPCYARLLAWDASQPITVAPSGQGGTHAQADAQGR